MLRLNDHWYIAAPRRELSSEPIRRNVEGEVLVLFRDETGTARALRDRCAHRGMALSEGRVVDGTIECPYHGWRYDGAGDLVEVPALCPGECPPQGRRMQSFSVVEQDDHLWVWIGSGEPTSGPYHFTHYGDPGWRSFFMNTRFEATVEDCLENFLDVPHTIFVHPGLFRRGELAPTRARVTRESDTVVAEFLNEAPLQGWGPRLVFPKGTVMRHTDRFILPSITRVDYSFGEEYGFVITSQCTQREESVVDVTTAITWRLPRSIPMLSTFLRWYCRRVIRQDVDMLRVQGQQHALFGRAFTHTEADLLGRHIARLRRRSAEGLVEDKKTVEEVQLRI